MSDAYVVRRCRLRGPAPVDRDSCVERGAPPGATTEYAATQAAKPRVLREHRYRLSRRSGVVWAADSYGCIGLRGSAASRVN